MIELKKVQYAVYRRETGNAGGKAKNDVMDILFEEGFSYSYYPSDYRPIRILQQLVSIIRMSKYSVLVVQYPAVSLELTSVLIKKVRKLRHSIVIVHDLRSLQTSEIELKKEIDVLNEYQYVIVHNNRMLKLLLDNGCTSKLVSLDIFDYLHDDKKPLMSHEFDSTVCIAGNLGKSVFIKDLGSVSSCKFNLFGIQDGNPVYAANVTYRGLLNSEEIVYKLEGDYGLIWDGVSIDTCDGVAGKYLLYNNPHKLSLYIASGKPVITWSGAAISDFVRENKIGIVVDSLLDLNSMDLYKGYDEMKRNVLKLKTAVARGEYMKRAIDQIMREISE